MSVLADAATVALSDTNSAGSTQNMAKATVFDVAELAGVSIKTVSRVVNSEPHVRPATKERVDHAIAIAKLDYEPNQFARFLASQRQ